MMANQRFKENGDPEQHLKAWTQLHLQTSNVLVIVINALGERVQKKAGKI